MHDIPMHSVSEDFARAWSAAGNHIENAAQVPLHSWLRAHLNPPFLEHLSFRLGNQLFFIRIESEDGRLEVPGSRSSLETVARGCGGHACLMPMRRTRRGWQPTLPGWGLADARSGRSVHPPALISDEEIEMSDWELQDFAVQVVRQQLEDQGRELMSWQSNLEVDSSLWFVGDHGPEWVIVRTVRGLGDPPGPTARLEEIARGYAATGRIGHLAEVYVLSARGLMSRDKRLLRGHALMHEYEGLKRVVG